MNPRLETAGSIAGTYTDTIKVTGTYASSTKIAYASVTITGGGCVDCGGDVRLSFIALPEKRVPKVGNDDSHVIIEVRSPGSAQVLFSQTVDTSIDGQYSNVILSGISPGVYDLIAKGYSHLRRKKSNITLSSGENILDFTDAGLNKLLCGDVNEDNKVNAIDVTIIVKSLFVSEERTDLNQDSLVNAIDITNMVVNFNKVGD